MLTEVIKFITGIFSSIISPQTLDLLFRFKFYRALKVLKTVSIFVFLLIGYTQHLLEKSSINDTKYLAPPKDITGACQTS